MKRKSVAFLGGIIIVLILTMLSLSMVGHSNAAASQTPKFMVYRTIHQSVNSKYVEDVATRVFDIANPIVEYADGLYIVRNEYPRHLQVYEASGSVMYTDFSKMHNELYAPNLPSKEEAATIAESFLTKYELMPEEAYLKDISYTTTAIFHADTQEVETRVNSINVVYGFRTPQGIPIEGPGAKITVSLGEDGEIIGLHWAWRTIRPHGKYPGISEPRAVEVFCEKLDVPVRLEIRLAYYSEPAFFEQEFLQPYYIFNYEATVHNKPLASRTQKMPAIVSSRGPMSNSLLGSAFTWPILAGTVAGLSLARKRKEGQIAFMLIAVISISAFTISTPIVFGAGPNDDSLNTEVGDEWICAYPAYKGPLQHCDEDARGFRDQLRAIGWTSRFDWGDSLAWEEDFKYRNAPGGGTDYVWIDAVDFAYFAGHGSVQCTNTALIYFSVNYDYQTFSSNNARWGGNDGGSSTEEADLEFIVLDACLTLKETHSSSYDVFQRWDQAFCGLHYILGFHTVCYDTGNQGPRYGYYLRIGYTVREAWITSTKEVQSSSVWGAYMRAGNTLYDKINPYSVSPDPYPYGYLAYMKWQC